MLRALTVSVDCADYALPKHKFPAATEHNNNRNDDEAFFIEEMRAITASVKKIEDRFSSNPLNGTINFHVQVLAETPSSAGVTPECKVFNIWKFGQQQQSSLPERDRTSVRVARSRAQLTEIKPEAHIRSGNSFETVSDEQEPDQPGEVQANQATVSPDVGKPKTPSLQPHTEHVNRGCPASAEPAQGSGVQALPDANEDQDNEEDHHQQKQDEIICGSTEEVEECQAQQKHQDEALPDSNEEENNNEAEDPHEDILSPDAHEQGHKKETEHPQGDGMLPDSSEEQQETVPPQPQVGGVLSGSGKQVQNGAFNQQEGDEVLTDPNAEQHKEKAKQDLPSCPVNMKQSIDLPSNQATEYLITCPEESGKEEYSGPRFASSNDAVVPSAPASVCFVIPSGVADRCLRLLLQGSGAMKHRKWPSQIMRYAQIRNEDMAVVLDKLMDHRRATNRRKAAYRILLPKELYGKDVQVLPVMSLGDHSKEYSAVHLDPVNTGQLTGNFRCWTKLNRFVILCGILMFPSNSDAAEQRIITNHATEGMGPEGCVRASRFCKRMGCSRTKPEETKPDGAESEEKQTSGNNRKRYFLCKLRLKPKRAKRGSE